MPPHRFLSYVGFFLPLIMVLTWIVSVASMVRRLVYEREIQMEEVSRPGLPGTRGSAGLSCAGLPSRGHHRQSGAFRFRRHFLGDGGSGRHVTLEEGNCAHSTVFILP